MSDGQIEQGAFVAGSAEKPRVGEALRAARESRGESQSDVADALKLTQRQVDAMESGRFELLPGPAFVRGFVRNYARHVGLDTAVVLALLEHETAAPAVELAPVSNAEGIMPSGHGARTTSHRPAAVVVTLLVLAVAAGWYFDWFKKPDEAALTDLQPVPGAAVDVAPPAHDPQVQDGTASVAPGASSELRMSPAPVPPTWEPPAASGETTAPSTPNAVAPQVIEPAAAPTAPAPMPGPAPATEAAPSAAQGDQLLFRVEGESWIEVRDASGSSVFSSVVPAGNTRTVQGKPPFKVVIGNAPHVRIEYRGQPVDLGRTNRGVARITVQ